MMLFRQAVFLALFFCGTLYGHELMANDSAVVFMYHRFGEQQYPSTNVRPDQFKQHLDYLRDGGFAVIPLEELMTSLSDGGPLPPKAVVITVDDAYRSVFETAYPMFSEYGFPFTVFVSSDPIDQGFSDYMSWDQLREMAGNGVTFANHGSGHISLPSSLPGETDAQWQERIVADIEKGSRRLAEELSGTGQLLRQVFAYPFGEYNLAAAEQVTKLGYMAFGQQSGAVGRLSDRRALPRYPMAESFAGMSGFRTKAMSLPMPVTELVPWDPVTTKARPEITITLGETDARLAELACYVSGQGQVEIRWEEMNRRFSVGPSQRLGKGHQRVNCTAPGDDGRYLWFSHQWLVR